jgi:uncharacterized protein
MRSARLTVRVAPGARSSEIVGRNGDAWKVRVAALPWRGQANEAVAQLFAAALGVPRRQVTLVKGTSSRDKVIEIEGLAAVEADRRLTARARREER